MGVEPTYATSDVLNHYTIEASLKKDAQVAYITTPDAAVHSVYGFYINYFSVQNYDISLICSSDTCLFRPQWRHNPYKYFDFCGDRGIPKKDAQVAYITTPDAAVHSIYGSIFLFLCIMTLLYVLLEHLFEHLFGGCLNGVMVKDVRRCSARRPRRIHGFDPHRSRNIYMDYVSTMVEKDKCRCYR